MRFRIQDKKKCAAFISIFQNLKYFTDNVLVKINETQMYIQGMDNSHISMYELKLDHRWFYEWVILKPFEFGLYLPNFNKILQVWSEKQTIIIHIDEDESGEKLNIDFTSDEKGVFDKYLQMPLMDIQYETLYIPDTEYDVDLSMESCKVKHIVDELASFSDTIHFRCENETVEMESNSAEGGVMKVLIGIDDVESMAITENEVIQLSFSIRHIAHICRFYKISENCSIHLSKDIPIKIKYGVDSETDSKMSFYLAPTINE